MQELEKRLEKLAGEFDKAYEKLGMEEKAALREKLEQEVAEPEIWNNVE